MKPAPPWPFNDWTVLYLLDLFAQAGFLLHGLPPPCPGDSPQRIADKFTALLSSDPWPGYIKTFWRPDSRARVEYVALVVKWAAKRPLKLSCTRELTGQLFLVTVRNAAPWYERRHEREGGDWKGFLLCHRRTIAKRLDRSSRPLWTGSAQGQSPPLELGEPYRDILGGLPEDRKDRVRAAVRRLTPEQQRIIRLKHGWWPARKPWSKRKIMRILQIDSETFDRQQAAAFEQLFKDLKDHFG